MPASRKRTPIALTAPELGPHAINPCFAAGTHILTEQGEVPADALAVGDIVILADGEAAPITWIGRRDLDFSRHPAPAAARPVRFAAGALSTGVPERELLLSPDHALYFDGALVQAKDLVDGIVIRQDFDIAAIRYIHIGLARHAILLAEGAAAESYLDTGNAMVFTDPDMPMTRGVDPVLARRGLRPAAPLVTGGDALAAIRARLHARKLMLGLTVAETKHVCLAVNDLLISPVEASGWLLFDIPPGVTGAILQSPVHVPAETDPASPDRRRLGIAISEVMLNDRFVTLETLFDPDGLYVRAARDSHSWTKGDVRLALPVGTTSLALKVVAFPKQWRRVTGVR